jgi:FKBP-type peptidyl-prolyl cis-trans isomerase
MRAYAASPLAWLVIPLLAGSTGSIGLAGCNQGGSGGPTALESEDAKVNYTVGWQLGGDYKRQGVPLDADALLAGVSDAIEGKEARIPEAEQRQLLAQVQQRRKAAGQATQGADAEKNLAAAKAFLDENAKLEGVKTLPSGLQYKVVTEGAGPKPAATDVVTVNYRGTLIDGTEFDSSYGRGQPASFPLNRVIRAWTEGLQLMGEGSKWILYVPPDLGYGAQGAPGGKIPPQSALVFEVELLKAKQ